MTARSDDPLDRVPESPKPAVAIWFCLIAPPLMALLHLQIIYPLDHVACSTGTKLLIHGYTILSLIVVAIGGWIGRREWIRLGSRNPQKGPGPEGTLRLMALMGMIGALLFALFIVAQWFPTVMLSPCIRT